MLELILVIVIGICLWAECYGAINWIGNRTLKRDIIFWSVCLVELIAWALLLMVIFI